MITTVLHRLGIKGYSEVGLQDDVFTEGLELKLGKKALVRFGVVSKNITKQFDIENEVLFADFNWDQVLAEITSENFQLRPIPKFPQVKRDFALLLDDSANFNELKSAAMQTEKKLLKDVRLFDVYTGKNLPKGKKSYALSFTLQDDKKTLTDKQIDKIMKKLEQRFSQDFGATLR